MYKRNDLFNHFLNGMESGLQAQMRLYFTHQMMLDEYNRKRELEQLKREIISEILSQISVSVDITEAVSNIKEIQREINKIGD